MINYNPDKVMSSAFAKMLRAAGANINTAWISWRMATLAGNSAKMALAKRNLAAKNIHDVLDKKRKKHLRSGVRPLADGVAATKMQTKIFNRMHYIAFGKLKNAFRDWTEELSKYNDLLNAKRIEIVTKLCQAAMSKHAFSFMIWKNWVKREMQDEACMKKMVDKMLRSAGLMVYNLFTRWKLATFTDLEKKREMKKNGKLNAMFNVLDRTHRNHLKAGFSGAAGESMNTAARQRIINKLGHACFGRMKESFDSWKYDTHAKYKAEMERKKAKVIDEFVRSAMSPLQKSFCKWARNMRDAAKQEFGNQVKAGFCLTSLLTRYLKANKEKYTRLAWKRLDHNPDKIMSSAFNKMLRAAG